MKLTWINHSGFVASAGGTNLVVDPWIDGSILNRSWDLLVPSKFDYAAFGQCKYLWFSHEHPDHFAVVNLKKIDPAHRQAITVLYQRTHDRRVVSFCASLGFKTRELDDHEQVSLGEDFSVMIGRVPFYDSWMLMRAGGLQVLNLNDCVIKTPRQAQAVARVCGKVDVLITQFSYANWVANPGELERMHASAREKLARIRVVAEAMRPKFIVPSASFVRFSHQENSYLNEGATAIREVVDTIAATGARPVLLLPAEEWDCRTPVDNERALQVYEKAQKDALSAALNKSNSVPFAELAELAKKYSDKVMARNSKWIFRLFSTPLLPLLSPLTLWLWDLNSAVRYSHVDGLSPVEGAQEKDADVSMSSDSLSFIFKFDFGYDTLEANGRFHARGPGRSKMLRVFGVGSLNNMGKSLSPGLVFDRDLVLRSVRKALDLRA